MRELKFRAWSEETKSFEYFDLYEGTECGLTNLQIWARNNPIEQYIGLKDKNSKEIYEGDIVATVYKTRRRTDEDVFGEGHYEWDEKIKGKFEVKYSGRATFGISYIKDPVVIRDLWELGEDIKVIGNIHENKELLEGK